LRDIAQARGGEAGQSTLFIGYLADDALEFRLVTGRAASPGDLLTNNLLCAQASGWLDAERI
jgi:hypothetical protein